MFQTRTRLSVWLVLALTLTGCGAGGVVSMTGILSRAGLTTLPEESVYARYGAVILFDETKTEFIFESNHLIRRETKHMALVYYNERADQWLTPVIYMGRDSKLESFKASTRIEGQEVIELGREDLYPTQIAPEFIEFTDNQSVKFTFKGVAPGAVLEYSYVIDYPQRINMFSRWQIQTPLPTCSTRYSIEIPSLILDSPNVKWIYYPVNLRLPKPVEGKHEIMGTMIRGNFNRTFSWHLKNIPALEFEENMPPFADVAQHVLLGIQPRSWNDLSAGYWDQVKNRFVPGLESGELAREIAGRARDSREKIASVYRYTQNDYRYVAVDMDGSGIMPNPFSTIVERKYGDCKDMTVLNVNMLRNLGFEANPALVNTRDAGRLHKAFVAMAFNHMITHVTDDEGNEYWLDSTGNHLPLGMNPPGIAGAEALVLYPDGTCDFKKIPMSEYDENTRDREIIASISPDGTIEGKLTMTCRGLESFVPRFCIADRVEETLGELMRDQFSDVLADLEIGEIVDRTRTPDAPQVVLCCDFTGVISDWGSSDAVYLNPGFLRLDVPIDVEDLEARRHNVRFNYPRRVRDTLTLSWNSDRLRLKSAPPSISQGSDTGALTRETEQVGSSSLIVETELIMGRDEYTKRTIPDLRELIKALKNSERQGMLFTTS